MTASRNVWLNEVYIVSMLAKREVFVLKQKVRKYNKLYENSKGWNIMFKHNGKQKFLFAFKLYKKRKPFKCALVLELNDASLSN